MIKDRGMMKWRGMMLPEHVQSLKELATDQLRERKPILDEYQIQEYEEKIHYAMAFNLPLKLSVWQDGFTDVYTVYVHYVDSLNKQIRAKDNEDMVLVIRFEDIVEVEVVE